MIKLYNKYDLRDLILKGITSEELNAKYDYSGITDMRDLFFGCKVLHEIPMINTENVTNMFRMFSGSSITTIPMLNTENVTNTSEMFADCMSLLTIPMLNTSKVSDMSWMFGNCISLTSVPDLDTSNVTNMNEIFFMCPNVIVDPFVFNTYNFDSKYHPKIKIKYPEFFI